MSSREQRARGGATLVGGLAMIMALLLLGVTSATALAAPKNTALPTISPATPKVGKEATATTGSWNSESPARWLSCTEQSGGKFSSNECGKEGSPNAWELVLLKEGGATSPTATGKPITYAATVSGIKGSVTCDNVVSEASISNPSGGGSGTGSAKLTYQNCVAGGSWSSCKAESSSVVPVTLAMSTVEGKAKIVISPTGANLGSFALSGASCPAGIVKSYSLWGTINGVYSNSASQIEYNAETSGGGQLRLNSSEGVKTSATGSIGLKGAGGSSIQANSITYTYAWKRCSGSCEVIAGATTSSYTPVAADQGKTLKVAVTATDSSASATAESSASGAVKASLSWYASSGGWQRLTSPTSFTASNTMANGEVPPYVISWTWGGPAFEISCTGGSGSGTLSNSETQASVDSLSLTLTGCSVPKAPSCGIEGNKIVFNTLSATSPTESASKLNPELKFVPKAGEVIAGVGITGCGLGHYSITGYFPALVNNGGSTIESTAKEVGASKGMRIEGATGPVVSMTSSTRILSEGVNPLKLDIAP